jgi:hypothetical protein
MRLVPQTMAVKARACSSGGVPGAVPRDHRGALGAVCQAGYGPRGERHLRQAAQGRANLILDAELQDDTFRLRFDGLKRVGGHSDLGPFH